MLHDGQWTPDVSGNLMPHLFVPDIQIDTFAPSDFKDFPGTTHPFIIHHIHPIASILVNPYIFFAQVPFRKNLLGYGVPMGHQGLIMRLRSPRSCMRKRRSFVCPGDYRFFFPSFVWCFGDNGRNCWQEILAMSLFCLGGRGGDDLTSHALIGL